MIAMQYKISLPDDYDMDTIRQRVSLNGSKTDGFKDLLFKAYLITEYQDGEGNKNEYSPLYIWNHHEGMDAFIFDGFYDNILESFGWQKINIGISMHSEIGQEFQFSNYVLEIEHDISETEHMKRFDYSFTATDSNGKVLIYNPDKWNFTEFYFYRNKPLQSATGKVYKILHISM